MIKSVDLNASRDQYLGTIFFNSYCDTVPKPFYFLSVYHMPEPNQASSSAERSAENGRVGVPARNSILT
jgi:hypothetical protein